MNIDITKKKVLFLGYGAVGKGVWNYFHDFFDYDRKKIFLVDKNPDTFIGPNLEKVKKIVMNVNVTNFENLLHEIGLKKHDIIIDLSTSTPTYFFIKICFERGFYYINTSIEDNSDEMLGRSIYCQQKMISSIAKSFPHAKSAIVTECGQNPGLIQHYIKYALHKLDSMKKDKNKNDYRKNDYRKSTLIQVIDDFKIGTILMSEIDMMKKQKTFVEKKGPIIYNTWSANGYLYEALDSVELVQGKGNKYIQPVIMESQLNKVSNNTIKNLFDTDKETQKVTFLHSTGLETTINSICPILQNKDIAFTNFRGKMIHHGEIFEMSRYFGEKAPFMSYVYKTNIYADESISNFYKTFPNSTVDDLFLYLNQNNTFHIFNGKDVSGHDSIGCTIFCGENSIEQIFWCGSILSTTDDNVKPEYTPTIVQVVAGVLSGLSFVLENKVKGWVEPADMDTPYILNKSKALLGKLAFLEIPVKDFQGPFSIQM